LKHVWAIQSQEANAPEAEGQVDEKLEKLQMSFSRLKRLRVLIDNTALSQLKPDQPCIVVMQNGQIREAVWVPDIHCFRFSDQPPGTVDPHEVAEWWPAAFSR
jgi:hypothetical protein